MRASRGWVVIAVAGALESSAVTRAWHYFENVSIFADMDTPKPKGRGDECERLPSPCNDSNTFCASFRLGMDALVPSFPVELCKLELLVRSIARHDVCRIVRDIHVPWVSAEPMGLYETQFRRVQAAAGRNYKVFFREPRVGAVAGGWFEQQIVKLMAHAYLASPWYLVLDSKNVFLNSLTLHSLFAHQRFIMTRRDQIHQTKWYDAAADALAVNFPLDAIVKPPITPAIFNTERIRDMLAFLEIRGVDFTSLVHRIRYTPVSEFTLYEVFSCCAGRPSTADPWLDETIAEAVRSPHRYFMAWNFHGNEADLNFEALNKVVTNSSVFDSMLVAGWHHTLSEDYNVSVPVVRAVFTLLKKARVIDTLDEECAFLQSCAYDISELCPRRN